MILLDTNVLSEFMRPNPDLRVVAWLDAQPASRLWTSAITRAEIELGLALMPAGRRKEVLAATARIMFEEDFAHRCLAFEEQAATCYAQLTANRTRSGNPISVEDAQIAAIALANKMQLATRNTRDFLAIDGLILLNPWA